MTYIQAAVNKAAASGDTVQVAAGIYREDVDIVNKALKIFGADPTITIVSGFTNAIYAHNFQSPTKLVEIVNLYLTAPGGIGVNFSGGNIDGFIRNCIFRTNQKGFYTTYVGNVRITNNVFMESYDKAVDFHGSILTLSNNVFMNNATAVYRSSSTINSSYNSYFNNTTNRSSGVVSTNDLDGVDCKLIDPDSGDYHLQEESPCINAGSPSPADNDYPDGTRNDIGVYGGYGTIDFCCPGLPIVTNLFITPSAVNSGGTFTIQATGKAQ